METEDIIKQLTQDAEPVKRLHSPSVRFFQWLMISTVYIASLLAVFGIRDDVSAQMTSPLFLWQVALMILFGLLAGFMAFYVSIPGRELPRFVHAGVTIFLILYMLTLVVQICVHPECEAGPGWACSLHITMLGIAPAIAIIYMLKKTAPVQLCWTGILLGFSITGLASAAMHFSCASGDPLHLLVWHLLPGAIFVVAGIVLASRWLRW